MNQRACVLEDVASQNTNCLWIQFSHIFVEWWNIWLFCLLILNSVSFSPPAFWSSNYTCHSVEDLLPISSEQREVHPVRNLKLHKAPVFDFPYNRWCSFLETLRCPWRSAFHVVFQVLKPPKEKQIRYWNRVVGVRFVDGSMMARRGTDVPLGLLIWEGFETAIWLSWLNSVKNCYKGDTGLGTVFYACFSCAPTE